MLTGGCDSPDVDKVLLDDAVGVDKNGVVCSCSNKDGAVGYGVVGLIDPSEYSDIVRLFDIGDGTGGE